MKKTYANYLSTKLLLDDVSYWMTFLLTIVNFNHFFIQPAPAVKQFVNKFRVTTLQQLDKITALLQLVEKLATIVCREHILLTSCDIFRCVHMQKSHNLYQVR